MYLHLLNQPQTDFKKLQKINVLQAAPLSTVNPYFLLQLDDQLKMDGWINTSVI